MWLLWSGWHILVFVMGGLLDLLSGFSAGLIVGVFFMFLCFMQPLGVLVAWDYFQS